MDQMMRQAYDIGGEMAETCHAKSRLRPLGSVKMHYRNPEFDGGAPMWRMYGHLRNGLLTDIGSRSYVVMQRLPHPIVEVEVAMADAQHPATHWGWLQKGASKPSSIWPTEELYRTCFHDSPESQEKAGYGRTVRLTVRPVGRLASQ